jgi:putative iron-dependent peroxidase
MSSSWPAVRTTASSAILILRPSGGQAGPQQRRPQPETWTFLRRWPTCNDRRNTGRQDSFMTDTRQAAPPLSSQAVLSPLTGSAIFLIATITTGGELSVRELLADIAGLQRSVGFRVPSGELSCVTGIGADAWDRLFAADRPAGLHPFREISGARHHAPATPGDLLFHIRAGQLDLCFELAAQIVTRLADAATIVDEVHGFKYFDERDLLGFVDGTENPTGDEARVAVTVDDGSAYAGGSFVVVQKYLHDLASWNRLSVEEQEKVIGRTKLNNIELPDDVKPLDSHVALNTIVEPDGTERAILRDNMPFGSPGKDEYGTYYIAYAADPDVIERMLHNMFVGDPPGNYDRILDFSAALTGGLFYVPTAGFLDDQPPPHRPELRRTTR